MGGVNLRAFRSQVENATALDGDLVLKGSGRKEELNKVNYGGARARRWCFWSSRKTTARAEQTQAVVAKFYNSIKADLMSKQGIEEGTRNRLLADIRQKLHIDGAGDDGADITAADVQRGNSALSRREVRRILEYYDEQTADGLSENDKKAQKASSWGGVDAKRIGGKHGLHLKLSEITALVKHLKERGLETFAQNDQRFTALRGRDRALAVQAFKLLADDCLNGYQRGSSRGLIEKAFSGGLELEAIGRQLADMVLNKSELPTPLLTGTKDGDNLISGEARRCIDKYRTDVENDPKVSEMVKFDGEFEKTYRAESKTLSKDPNFRFVADLICNSDAIEVADYGFNSGSRVARVLMNDPNTFFELCQNVAEKDRAAKGRNLQAPKEHEVFALLKNGIGGDDAAKTLESMIRQINAKCFPDGLPGAGHLDAFRWTCFAQAEKIEQAAGASYGGATFEQTVDRAMSAPGKKEGIAGDLVALVLGDEFDPKEQAKGVDASRNLPLYHALMASVEHADVHMLRRMHAAAMRYAPEGFTSQSPLDQSKMLMEMGPVVHKLLQERLSTETDPKALQALACIRGDLPGLGTELVKAMVADVVNKVNSVPNGPRIESITLLDSLGAASIAQTFKARIKFEGEQGEGRTVAIKLLRPDVENHYKAEISSLLTSIDAKLEKVDDSATDVRDNLNMVKTQFEQRRESVGKEFDLSSEMDNALRCYANLLPADEGQDLETAAVKTVKPVLRLGDGNTLAEFNTAVRTYKAHPTAENLNAVKAKTVPCTSGVMIAEFIDAPTVDKLVAGDLSKKECYQLLRALEKVSVKMLNGLINSTPPYVHLDMHASNLLVNVKQVGPNKVKVIDGITLIDHGKQFDVTEQQRQKLMELLDYVSNKDRWVSEGMKRGLKLADSEKEVVEKAISTYKDYIKLEKESLAKKLERLEQLGGDQQAQITEINERLALLNASIEKLENESERSDLVTRLRDYGLYGKPLAVLHGVCSTLDAYGYYTPSVFKDFVQTFVKLFQCEDLVMKKLELDSGRRKGVLHKMEELVGRQFGTDDVAGDGDYTFTDADKRIRTELKKELAKMRKEIDDGNGANIEGCLSRFCEIIRNEIKTYGAQDKTVERARKFLKDNFIGDYEIDDELNLTLNVDVLECPPKVLQNELFGLEEESKDPRDVGIVHGFSEFFKSSERSGQGAQNVNPEGAGNAVKEEGGN